MYLLYYSHIELKTNPLFILDCGAKTDRVRNNKLSTVIMQHVRQSDPFRLTKYAVDIHPTTTIVDYTSTRTTSQEDND
jgi:hypothetical protein